MKQIHHHYIFLATANEYKIYIFFTIKYTKHHPEYCWVRVIDNCSHHNNYNCVYLVIVLHTVYHVVIVFSEKDMDIQIYEHDIFPHTLLLHIEHYMFCMPLHNRILIGMHYAYELSLSRHFHICLISRILCANKHSGHKFPHLASYDDNSRSHGYVSTVALNLPFSQFKTMLNHCF